MKIKVTKKLHLLWKEHQKALKIKGYKELTSKIYPDGVIGKWKWDYESKKGKISLISFPKKTLVWNDKEVWEIYAYENGKLFKDIKRFDTKEEAEKEIRRYLECVQSPIRHMKGGEKNGRRIHKRGSVYTRRSRRRRI